MKNVSKLAAALVAVAVFAIVSALTGCSSSGATDASPGSAATSAPTKTKTHHHHTGTVSQREAIASAKQYLQTQGFSKKGLIKQLSSKYGEGYSKADAKYAVNHIDVDWNAQAVRVAKNYLDTMPMSQSKLVDQLESPYGDQFTHAQAVHGAKVAYAQR